MGAFRSLAIMAVGTAVGGAALIAYRISQETGKSMQEAITDVPAEAQRLFADLKGRAGEALERGRQMYEERQQEIIEQFTEDASAQ